MRNEDDEYQTTDKLCSNSKMKRKNIFCKMIYPKTKKKKMAWLIYFSPEEIGCLYVMQIEPKQDFSQMTSQCYAARSLFSKEWQRICWSASGVSVLYSSKVEVLMVSQRRHFGNCWNLDCIKTDCPCVLLWHQLTVMKSIEVGHISITWIFRVGDARIIIKPLGRNTFSLFDWILNAAF